MDMIVAVYDLLKELPNSEKFGLQAQIKRCAVNIPPNIAEGSMRKTKKDYQHFLIIAYGSGAELETQLEIINRIGFVEINSKKYQRAVNLLDEVMKMLNKILSNMRRG